VANHSLRRKAQSSETYKRNANRNRAVKRACVRWSSVCARVTAKNQQARRLPIAEAIQALTRPQASALSRQGARDTVGELYAAVHKLTAV